MKQKRNTILKLIIVIAIVAIAFFIAKNAFNMLKQKEIDDIETDLLLVQAKVKVIKGKSDVSSNTDVYVGTKASEIEDESIKEFLKSLNIDESDFEQYYVLSSEDFDRMEIKDELKKVEHNVYIVNYDTAEIIYRNGVEVEGNNKYKISEIIKKENPKYWILYNRAEVSKWKKKK